jgi:hypothetical protein
VYIGGFGAAIECQLLAIGSHKRKPKPKLESKPKWLIFRSIENRSEKNKQVEGDQNGSKMATWLWGFECTSQFLATSPLSKITTEHDVRKLQQWTIHGVSSKIRFV